MEVEASTSMVFHQFNLIYVEHEALELIHNLSHECDLTHRISE